ncbi:MAG: DUF1780 domain-containing protein [Nitrospirota bacterium]|nr:DUF1780 domain-containing protein [Nitrospirota bacterium]
MEFEEYKKEIVEHFRESVRLFSNKGKKELELWTAQKFLNVLDVPYTDSELRQPKDEPPDVAFRDARFEIIELYDEDRRRHDEYRDKLKKAEIARDYSELLAVQTWDLELVSLTELLASAAERLERKKGKYSPDTKANLDIIIYVNLPKITIDDEDYVFSDQFPSNASLRRWRSVSLVFNRQIVCVAYASVRAPEFIQNASNRVIRK